jgi:hypothetical protein
MESVGLLELAVLFHLPHFSMDHRVKPGGDEKVGARRRNSAPGG